MGKLASKGQPGVQYAKVDLGKNPQMGQEYGVSNIPDTRIFHDGEEIGGFVGGLDAASLEKMVGQYLSSVPLKGELNPTEELVQPAIQPEPLNRSLPKGITPVPAS